MFGMATDLCNAGMLDTMTMMVSVGVRIAATEEERQHHESGTMSACHQERPDGEVAGSYLHSTPPWMTVANDLHDPHGYEKARYNPFQEAHGDNESDGHSDYDRYCNGQCMADGERKHRLPDSTPTLFLEPQCYGEQPSHGRIDTVKGTKCEKRDHGPRKVSNHGGPGCRATESGACQL
jgi:hypothetical protein